MSGHEKFYIPHDDLVSLEAAIASLETTMDTLNASVVSLEADIEELHDNLSVPGRELHIDNYEPVTASYEVVTLRNTIISTTDNVFLRRVIFRVYLLTLNPFTDYTSGVNLYIGDEDDNIFLYETIDGDRHRPINTQDPAAGAHEFDITFQINDAKLSANKKLLIICRVANLVVDTILFTRIAYTTQL